MGEFRLVSRKGFAILLVLVLVVALGVVIYLELNEKSTAYPEPAAPSYIDDSKIFLLTANSSYSYYGLTHCFVIHVTIRNDYTPQQPPDNLTENSTGLAWLILEAKLYEKDNNQIAAQYYTQGFPPNYKETSLGSGETTDLEVIMATTSHNVDHYVLVFGWLGSIAAP